MRGSELADQLDFRQWSFDSQVKTEQGPAIVARAHSDIARTRNPQADAAAGADTAGPSVAFELISSSLDHGPGAPRTRAAALAGSDVKEFLAVPPDPLESQQTLLLRGDARRPAGQPGYSTGLELDRFLRRSELLGDAARALYVR